MPKSQTTDPQPEATPGSLLLSDRPANLEVEADAFGHDDYAAALAALVQDVRAPFTVGLFGPWGQGKSTVLERLDHHLPADVVVITFDAWRHEGHALRRQFLKALTESLTAEDLLPTNYVRRRLRLLDADIATTRPTVAFSLGRLLRALVPAVLIAAAAVGVVALVRRQEFDETLHAAPWAVLGSVIALGGFLTTLMSGLVADAQESTTLKRLDEPDRFTDEFERLLRSVDARRLIVVIDNLDRCSPDRALETLSTVKTYLEPAAQHGHSRSNRWTPWKRQPPTDAIFIVAVDEAALRRHLVAKELADSSATGAAPDRLPGESPVAESAGDEARRYVAEYLRKFFGLTMSVHDLLNDDMRAYTRAQLAPTLAFWTRGEASDEDTARIADFITFAIGRNPRRIKQFINSLSGRLQLITARETSKAGEPARLIPPISPHVELVLLLALMAEVWPEHFRLLHKNPPDLTQWFGWAEWQLDLEAVVEGMQEAGDDPADEDLSVFDLDGWPHFAEFLRRSSRPPSDLNLRAFFTLKQTALEVKLPNIGALERAIRTARWDDADQTVHDAGPSGAAYVRQLGDLVEDARSKGYAGSAAAYVRALLKMPIAQREHPDEASGVIGRGYRAGGRIAEDLFANGPEVLACLTWMRAADVRAVVGVVAARTRFLTDAHERRRWLEAISDQFDAFPPEARDMIKNFAADDWGTRRIQLLLEAHPELLPDTAIDDVLDHLDRLIAELPGAPPASDRVQRQTWVESVLWPLEQLRLWTAGHRPDQSISDRIVAATASLLPGVTVTTDQDLLQALLLAATSAVGEDLHPSAKMARTLSGALDAAWTTADPVRRPQIILLAERAVLSAEPADQALAALWRSRATQAGPPAQ